MVVVQNRELKLELIRDEAWGPLKDLYLDEGKEVDIEALEFFQPLSYLDYYRWNMQEHLDQEPAEDALPKNLSSLCNKNYPTKEEAILDLTEIMENKKKYLATRWYVTIPVLIWKEYEVWYTGNKEEVIEYVEDNYEELEAISKEEYGIPEGYQGFKTEAEKD